jgi:repressor LexA
MREEIRHDYREEVFVFVRSYIGEHGYPPTIREIAEGVGYASSSSAHNAVRVLINDGRLFGSPGRSLRLTP